MSYVIPALAPADAAQRHMLIVDDDLQRYTDPSEMFENSNIRVDVKIARFLDDALPIIDAWAQQGIRPDIITCDDNTFGRGDYGWQVLATLLPHLKDTYGDAYLPDDFFIHSKMGISQDDIPGFGSAQRLSTHEFYSSFISASVPPDEMTLIREADFSSTHLRAYCNEKWGTDFILSEKRLSFAVHKNKALPILDILTLVTNNEVPFADGLRRLAVQDDYLIEHDHFSINSDEPVMDRDFLEGVGPALSGRLALDGDDIARLRKEHPADPVILCLPVYTPDMLPLLAKADGLILLGDGREHLKAIIENNGQSAVMGFDQERAESFGRTMTLDAGELKAADLWDKRIPDKLLRRGDFVSICSTFISEMSDDFRTMVYRRGGCLYLQKFEYQPTYTLPSDKDFYAQCDAVRRAGSQLALLANADTAQAVASARKNGAEGIGLVRTEHMLMADAESRALLETVFMTEDAATRASALALLGERQRDLLADLMTAADPHDPDFQITIRLLDAPLDEFLTDAQVAELTARMGGEHNIRGCQIARKIDGLYAMQIAALRDAARAVDWTKPLKILIPYVRWSSDVMAVRDLLGNAPDVLLGAMIESGGAVHNADSIARACDFLSIGTNDLMTDIMGGVRRHDVPAIDAWMIKNQLTGPSPFMAITQPLKKYLNAIVFLARLPRSEPDVDEPQMLCGGGKPGIEISLCGQQAGTDPTATAVAMELGLNAVSVSPKYLTRVRVTAAHYALLAQGSLVAAPESTAEAAAQLTPAAAHRLIP